MNRIRVGIIGLQPEISWAARAHLPALRAQPDRFEIAGVANTSLASAEAAARACGIPRAFDSVRGMAEAPEIDLLSVTVRVPYHLELVRAALAGGKHVYCEWPLGNGLAEAEEMERLAREAGVLAVAGTQARVSPVVRLAGRMIADGAVGRVLSATVTARGRSWGATHADARNRGYLLHNRNGATMLTIPLGHTLAAIQQVLGAITEVSAIVDNRRGSILLPETGETVPFDAPDQVAITGRIGDGAPISIHYRGGMPRDFPGLVWEINGTEGDLRITGLHGGAQQVDLALDHARGDQRGWTRVEVPEDLTDEFSGLDINPANVGRIYARLHADLMTGSRTTPSFADAVELHRLIEAVERASREGRRVTIRG
ncbi:Gfo/Idh/MocA family protein [Paracoccus pantotrophus]|uniref:Gfo/Idh/MocA family protein n=1 Tax=Paracoccus pantotrophus TaxID=82367 RepID=UPI0004B842F2|nr:Gfo/Idh/MocA family oxidoreductase [Paracoccus pantotrophus]